MYDVALDEVRNGRKESHWMWFIFPQFDGLGFSSMSKRFSIKTLDEARAYLKHPVLGPRLVQIAQAALDSDGSARDIFGTPDDLKLQSCATLFAGVSDEGSVFHNLLVRYFGGQADRQTLQLVERSS